MASRLVFNEARHTYALDGQWVPSVTGVISKAVGKPGLLKWSARLAAEWCDTNHGNRDLLGSDAWVKMATGASDRARDEAAEDGTTLHTLAERLLYGDPLPDADPDGRAWPDHIYRTAEQVARFLDAWGVEPVCHEAFVFSETERYAGRLDLLADLSDGRRWLLDWKTGATGVWPETALQLAAYRYATHISVAGRDLLMDSDPLRTGAVWVRPDGWELVPVRADSGTFEVFRHAMVVAEWARGRRDDSVGAPLPVPA